MRIIAQTSLSIISTPARCLLCLDTGAMWNPPVGRITCPCCLADPMTPCRCRHTAPDQLADDQVPLCPSCNSTWWVRWSYRVGEVGHPDLDVWVCGACTATWSTTPIGG
ncbi:hypothetical protein [Actinomadura kijaniata]|uniref:hypothetical protein n=1 Tax=Actinomadura kijaniata TaxID=46161 RepID=UPI00082C6887|nr:hypothetical protein [Actinomadura kijaniata]